MYGVELLEAKTEIPVKQFAYFAGIGAFGTAAHYAVLVALVELWGSNPIAASFAGFVLGALINYFGNYYITFQSTKRHEKTITRFFCVALVGLGLNTSLMAVATTLVGLHYLLSQGVATVLVLMWNFIANRFWTFRKEKERTE